MSLPLHSIVLALLSQAAAPQVDSPTGVADQGAQEVSVEKPKPQIDDATKARFERARAYAAGQGTYALLIQKAGEPFVSWAPEGSSVTTGYTLLAAPCSFWGVVGLLAVQDGLAESLDEKVSKTIVEWKEIEHKQDITLRQLLDFSSGIEPVKAPFMTGSAGDRFMLAVSLNLKSKPGEVFHYGPGSQYVFGEWMRRKLLGKNENALQFLKRRVFSKIGLDVVAWAIDRSENPFMAFGTNISAPEWAKFGELIKNKGKVGEDQLIDPKLVEVLFQPSKANPNHSLGFWTWSGVTVAEQDQLGLMDPKFQASGERGIKALAWVPKDLIFAAGQGRRLYIIPSADLVVVRMGESKTWSDMAFLNALLVDPPEAQKPAEGAPGVGPPSGEKPQQDG